MGRGRAKGATRVWLVGRSSTRLPGNSRIDPRIAAILSAVSPRHVDFIASQAFTRLTQLELR